MSKKAQFECYLHWEGIMNYDTTESSHQTYLGVYKAEKADDKLEDDCITPEIEEETSGIALCYLDDFAYKITSCVVKLTRIKTSGKGSKKIIERKNSFELDILNLVGDTFVSKLNKPTIHESILSDKIKTVCLTDVRGFKEMHIRPEFFSRCPKAKKVKSGEALFNDFNNIWSYIHRTDGPALISKAKDKNKLYVVNGEILLPEVNDVMISVHDRLDQDLIDLIEERGRSKKNVVD